jgi:hypothetical protein
VKAKFIILAASSGLLGATWGSLAIAQQAAEPSVNTTVPVATTASPVAPASTTVAAPSYPAAPPSLPGAVPGTTAADQNGDGIVDGYYTADGFYHPFVAPAPTVQPVRVASRRGERG